MEDILRLYIGGMDSCAKDGAIDILLIGEDISKPPKFPKIIYAMDVPIIWFWGVFYNEGDEVPRLPNALNEDFFTITYDYSEDELESLLNKIDSRRRGELL